MIYFIRAGADGPVKIGMAGNVASRLRGLQSAHWQTLHLVRTLAGGRLAEGRLHRHYAHLSLRGEWFSWDESMMTIELPLASEGSPGGPDLLAEIINISPLAVKRWVKTGYMPVWHGPALRLAADRRKLSLPWELMHATFRPTKWSDAA